MMQAVVRRSAIARLYRQYTQRWVALVILLVAIGGAVLIVKLWQPASAGEALSSVRSLDQCRKGQATTESKTFSCYATYYATKTYEQGEAAAMADVKQAYSSDAYVKAQCHQITHIVGRTSYKKWGSLDKAYEHGDSFCWSGFYHGGIEQAITDIGAAKVKAEAPSICDTFAKKRLYSFDHFNCVHGLGHGLMAVDDYNLMNALGSCDVLKLDWERQSCQGGVFMENVMVASRGNGTSAWFKDDQPLYPCTVVKTAYKQQCYLMQTSQVLQRNGYDFGKTFAECAKADVGFTDTCYQSLGRDASGSTVSDQDRTLAICRQAPSHDGLVGCMLGADRDFVSYFHSDQQARALCVAFGGIEAGLGATCDQDVTQYYKAF